MKRLYYDEVEDENVGFFGDERYDKIDDMFDDPEKIEAEEYERLKEIDPVDKSERLTTYKSISAKKNLLGALRNELDYLECDRGVLLFKANGINYEGVPMLEINPNKFVFKITSDAGDKDIMKAFQLSNIRLR